MFEFWMNNWQWFVGLAAPIVIAWLTATSGIKQHFRLQERKHKFEIATANREESQKLLLDFTDMVQNIFDSSKKSNKTLHEQQRQQDKQTIKLKKITLDTLCIAGPGVVKALDNMLETSFKSADISGDIETKEEVDEEEIEKMKNMTKRIERMIRAFRADLGHDDSFIRKGTFAAIFMLGDLEVRETVFDACKDEDYSDIKPYFK